MEEKHQYDKDFKIKFLGEGEWIEEPDSIKFMYKDYECLVYRVMKKEPCTQEEAWFGGHLCGYVVIPQSHPLYNKEIGEIDYIVCHGGITFSECHDTHLIGFDCGHSGDYVPTMVKFKNERSRFHDIFPIPEDFKKYAIFNPSYKNVSFCIDQCKYIVDQLIDLESK